MSVWWVILFLSVWVRVSMHIMPAVDFNCLPPWVRSCMLCFFQFFFLFKFFLCECARTCLYGAWHLPVCLSMCARSCTAVAIGWLPPWVRSCITLCFLSLFFLFFFFSFFFLLLFSRCTLAYLYVWHFPVCLSVWSHALYTCSGARLPARYLAH